MRFELPLAFPPPPPPPPPPLLLFVGVGLLPTLAETDDEVPTECVPDGVTDGVAAVPLAVRDALGERIGVPLSVLDALGGGAGHMSGVLSCEKSHPPGAHRAPMAGPDICPLTHRCAPAPDVHQPQLVGSVNGSARPSAMHVSHVASGGHLSDGSPGQ